MSVDQVKVGEGILRHANNKEVTVEVERDGSQNIRNTKYWREVERVKRRREVH